MDQNGLTDDRLFQRTADLVESGEGADVPRGLELTYKAEGIIRNGPQVIAVFASLGVRDENEARTLIALGRDVLSATQAEAIEQAEVAPMS